VVALDGADFTVKRGGIVGFLGPNGAGKTTAMRCVFGLVRPERGRVLWDGAPIDREQRLRFGYMPEERGLYPKMRIGEQLAYFGRLSGMTTKDAAASATRWLERLGLGDRERSRLDELSHGNQQRVQLAAALVHGPELLVLDEPFAGLDPIGIDALAAMLRETAAEGTAVVFSSHQLDLVEDVCEDVVIIHRGRVVVAGSVDRLRHDSPHRLVEITVDGRPWAPDLPGFEVTARNGARARYLVDRDAPLEELLSLARAEGEVTRFSYEPPTLSDLFREAVQS
jgi:ABC-2 type transport system ATP-binding protein